MYLSISCLPIYTAATLALCTAPHHTPAQDLTVPAGRVLPALPHRAPHRRLPLHTPHCTPLDYRSGWTTTTSYPTPVQLVYLPTHAHHLTFLHCCTTHALTGRFVWFLLPRGWLHAHRAHHSLPRPLPAPHLPHHHRLCGAHRYRRPYRRFPATHAVYHTTPPAHPSAHAPPPPPPRVADFLFILDYPGIT